MPPEFIEELATLQDNVPPLTEEQVVRVMEQELGVLGGRVRDDRPATPAAGTIAQVHRATLADHTRAVVKVQRPDAKEQIEQDLALLEVFAEKVADRPASSRWWTCRRCSSTCPSRCTASSTSARGREHRTDGLGDRRLLAARVPVVHADYSTSRLLVMQDIGGGRPPAARGAGAQGGGSAAARVLLQADPRRRLLPRRPASREPDVAAGGGDAVLPRPRHDRRGRTRPARST